MHGEVLAKKGLVDNGKVKFEGQVPAKICLFPREKPIWEKSKWEFVQHRYLEFPGALPLSPPRYVTALTHGYVF